MFKIKFLDGSEKEFDTLKGANLIGADLSGVDLSGVDLSGSNCTGVNFRGADLRGVNLIWANCTGANFRGANLSGVDLRRADLRGADSSGVDFSGVDLRFCIGNQKEIKNLEGYIYHVTIWRDVIAIDFHQHTKKEWLSFTEDEIFEMVGQSDYMDSILAEASDL